MIIIRGLNKAFGEKIIFSNFNLEIPDGSFVVISGDSGSGKSTLLNMIGGIEKPDSGSIIIEGLNITRLKNKNSFFADTVGFLFQNFALLENKTVKENLSLIKKSSRTKVSLKEALNRVGLSKEVNKKVYQLSGGEQQRVALARLMMKKGIRTEKGEFNRWIKATNAVIRDIKKKITLLFDWIAEAKAELAKPQTPDLVSLLNAYYTQRKAGAYSQKGKVSNLKEMNETFNYLRANGIYSLEDLESRVSEHSAATESLKKTLDEQTARMKAIKQLYDSSAAFQSLKPVYDGLQKIKFEKPRAKYKAEHETELKQFYAARRKLTGEFPDGKVDMKKLSDEYDELEQAHETTYGEFKAVRDDLHRLWKVKSCVDTAARFNERTEEQKLQNRPQTRQKKEDMTR